MKGVSLRVRRAALLTNNALTFDLTFYMCLHTVFSQCDVSYGLSEWFSSIDLEPAAMTYKMTTVL